MAKKIVTGALNLSKTSYNYNNGAIPGSKGALSNNIPDLINELRYTNGQIGSVQITTAYTLNNETIATGWYNYIYIPHRTGGKDGGVSGDNVNFGTLLLTGMTLATQIYKIRLHNGSIAELQVFARNNELANYLPLAGGTISGNLLFTSGTGSVLPSHFYRNMHDANGNVYDHYYKGTPTTNTTANLRVWDKTNNTFKTLRFGGDGIIQWNGNTFNAAAYRGVKTLTAKSHSNYGTNNNYVPDMSFIAYWNGAYSSGNASNLTYAHQGTIQCKPTNLYNNTGTGNNGTITLSQTAANFSYIDIYFYDQGGQANYTRVYSPNNKLVDLVTATSNSSYQNIWVKTRMVKISGTSITTQFYGEGAIAGGTYGKYNFIYVYRVDGWK